MKHLIKVIFIICFFLFLVYGKAQNCLKCVDSPNEQTEQFSILKSKFHLIQLYGDYSLRTTNFYNKHYNGNVGWVESRIIFPYFSELFSNILPLPDIFITATLKDLKDIYWEQRIDYGFGIEWRPFKRIHANLFPINWTKHLRIYTVNLSGYYLNIKENWRPDKDLRTGIELYRECNLYSFNENTTGNNYFWSEFWCDFSYRTTNFYINDFNTWVFGFVPKYGVKIFPGNDFTLMPYLTGQIQLTGRDEFMQNRLLLGMGLRIMPFKKYKTYLIGTFLSSCKIYIEFERNIVYFKDVPCSNIPKYDVSFGVTYSINRY